jgi:hypothetical protein
LDAFKDLVPMIEGKSLGIHVARRRLAAAWGYTSRPWLPGFCRAGALRRAGMARRASPTVQKREDVDMSLILSNLE